MPPTTPMMQTAGSRNPNAPAFTSSVPASIAGQTTSALSDVPSEAQSTGERAFKKSRMSISLPVVVILLVLFNIVTVTTLTLSVGWTMNVSSITTASSAASSSIQGLATLKQQDSSKVISLTIQAYLDKGYAYLQSLVDGVSQGLISVNDWDTQGYSYNYPYFSNKSIASNWTSSSSYLPTASAGFVKNIPKNTAKIVAPYTPIPAYVTQSMVVDFFDPSGNEIATGRLLFNVASLSEVLDSVQKLSTNRTLYYLLTADAKIMAISGLADKSILTKVANVTTNIYTLKTIWEYDYNNWPLLNTSAATIYSFVNGNLAANFADAQWRVGDYLFQVTTLELYSYKYIIVSGAVLFTWYFINKPLQAILVAMNAATKFNFGAVRNGTIQASIITEIRTTQSNFIEMLKVFAKALKRENSFGQLN
ncbi:hypothetical protein HDU93_002265 [Gonapodya sp. JEL0774]|nr:hypothetical protein HDU93_002265 [Gonapodya sp. JEL0774]